MFDTTLMIQQVTIAIVASALAVVTTQRFKGWFPSAKWVTFVSALFSVILGVFVARYYAGLDWTASGVVGFFTVIGAEETYKLISEKLTTYAELKPETVVKPEGTEVE